MAVARNFFHHQRHFFGNAPRHSGVYFVKNHSAHLLVGREQSLERKHYTGYFAAGTYRCYILQGRFLVGTEEEKHIILTVRSKVAKGLKLNLESYIRHSQRMKAVLDGLLHACSDFLARS